MIIEQSGKLLKKKITPFFASKRAVDRLTFKDIFRYAHKYSLLTEGETARWMGYRDNRNSTAHDYGEEFANETLVLIEPFLADAKNLKKIIDLKEVIDLKESWTMIDIKEKYLHEMIKIFNEYCPKAEIWAYGSRIGNDSHSGSDLDLAVNSFHDNTKTIYELRELLNDSNIPFLVDIHEFDKLPEHFRKEILKNYISIFPMKKSQVKSVL
ncbi:MAG TPA: hypothetical protein DCZ40_09055 [Lachnospiraceae bacterium]|nr:hypothetical protein [Lachnospiraceae bacterium]